MSPPVKTFLAKDLPSAAQVGANGKVRKTDDGRPIDLARDCELRGLVQYDCMILQPEVAHSPIQCWPVQRLFRKCQDKNGTFTVETTAWEGTTFTGASSGGGDAIAGAGAGQLVQKSEKSSK
ncbi:hypothetical protein QBC39DRAFT_361789 [Podospora conica]|nr:hypothetical protein QBC39DRAFT_361789 [Schizothecium conicum]